MNTVVIGPPCIQWPVLDRGPAEGVRARALILLILGTGPRLSEALGVRSGVSKTFDKRAYDKTNLRFRAHLRLRGDELNIKSIATGFVVGSLFAIIPAFASGTWIRAKDFGGLPDLYQSGYIEGVADTLSVLTAAAKQEGIDQQVIDHIDECMDQHTKTTRINFRTWALGAVQASVDDGDGGDNVASALLGHACP
jgi:hypothetical protein